MAQNITADGTVELEWEGGEGTFLAADSAAGTFGTFTLEWTLDGTTWTAVSTDTTLSANGGGNFQMPQIQLRVNLSGSSGANIDWTVERSDIRIN